MHKSVIVVSQPAPEPRSIAQHEDLVHALRENGADVLELPLVPGLPDSVFVKDNAVLMRSGAHRRAFMGWPKNSERQAEQAPREAALRKLGFEIADRARVNFEGGDLELLHDQRTALLGHGFRTDPAIVPQLSEFLGRRVIPLELTDPEFFHLDLAVAVLSDGTVFACREVLSPASWRTLQKLDAIRELVEVPRKEALEFCLNWIELDDVIVLAGRSESLIEKIESRGRRVQLEDLDEFHQRRGSVACLTSKLHDSGE